MANEGIVGDRYILLRNLSFSTALEVMKAGGCVTREETRIKSGSAPGIMIMNVAWLKEFDILANDWMMINHKLFFEESNQ